MSWRQELDALLPPDRADSAPITTHLRGLLEALHNGQGERPRITITLESDAWAMLEAQFRRPYRPHSSYTVVALDVGMVAFERRREAPASGLGYGQDAQGRDIWPPTTAPSDASWPEGPFPRIRVDVDPTLPLGTARLGPDAEGKTVEIRNIGWDAAAIEAKAASLSTPTDGTRPEGAIYSAPMTGAEATYGGPWKEPK